MAGLFGSAPKPPPTPRMPDQKDPTVTAQVDANRRNILATSGRAADNLTGSGGSQVPYTSNNLGGLGG